MYRLSMLPDSHFELLLRDGYANLVIEANERRDRLFVIALNATLQGHGSKRQRSEDWEGAEVATTEGRMVAGQGARERKRTMTVTWYSAIQKKVYLLHAPARTSSVGDPLNFGGDRFAPIAAAGARITHCLCA